ncbi:MAG: hypothetical protein ABSG36_15905 [Acidimicrobiales bacterium]
MDQAAIEAAYEPFVSTLREGGFKTPPQGWPAELIAAHVLRNNELIAEVGEAVAAGESPSYDNSAAVSDADLRVLADTIGGIAGLAGAVAASARRLAAAWAGLDETTEGYLLPVVIVDSGRVIRDTPVPIRAFIEGNASFHLEMHLDQLRALR